MLHLVRRFFGYLRATPLSPSEQLEIHDALNPDLRPLFFAQVYQDQRHALEVARRVGMDSEGLEAALCHDVGKTASGLGAAQRSLATLWTYTGFPVWGSWRDYLEHGRIGATALESAGARPLTVAFTRSHPGPVPEGIDTLEWHALAEADDA